LWAAQGAAAQSGGNNAAAIGADAGMAAQNRAQAATQALYGMGQGINAQSMQAGSAQDAMNMGLLQTQLGALGQDYQFDLARDQAERERKLAAFGMITDLGGTFMPTRGGGGGS
jgi:hypothetical protein